MNVELHIERLVLDGLPADAAQPHLVRRAIEAELASLLTRTAHAPRESLAVPSVPAPPLRLARNAGSARAGRDIARSLHAALAPAFPSGRRTR
jgi:hypothetical protein